MITFYLLVKYNLIRIVMNFAIKPPSLRQLAAQINKEETLQPGCCFPLFSTTQTNKSESVSNTQRFSQPKLKGNKKIELVIAKNRLSQAKFQQISAASGGNKNEKNQNQLKNTQNTNFTSLMSKATTQKNSLRNSRVKLNLQIKAKKAEDPGKKEKGDTMNNNHNKSIKKVNQLQQLRPQMSNIQYLSQISMIEQECVSHGSATLSALNFLSHFPFSQSKGYELTVTPVRYMIDAVNQKRKDQIRETPNPLQRLIQKKKGSKGEGKTQRLCL